MLASGHAGNGAGRRLGATRGSWWLLVACFVSAHAGAQIGSKPPNCASSRPFGPEGEVTLEAAAPDGSWTIVCSYAGVDEDPRVLLFSEGERKPIPLDELVGHSPSGRFVAFIRQGRGNGQNRARLVLRDQRSKSEVELPQAETEDEFLVSHHRAAHFAADAEAMVYLRKQGDHVVAVVRDLPSGGEQLVEPGPGLLHNADLDPSGRWVYLHLIVEDTNHDGRLTWGGGEAQGSPRLCHAGVGPVTYVEYFGGPPVTDKKETRVVSVQGGMPAALPFAKPFGDGLIYRTATPEEAYRGREMAWRVRYPFVPTGNEARAEHGAGTDAGSHASRADAGGMRDIPYIPSGCGGTTDYADPDGGFALATCSKEFVVFDAAGAHPTGVQRAQVFAGVRRRLLWNQAEAPRWLELVTDSPTVFDKQTRSVRPLPEGEVLALSDAYALLYQGGSFILFNMQDRKNVERIELTPEPVHPVAMVTRPMAASSGYVMDLDRGQLLGRYRGEPLALDSHGRVLLAVRGASGSRSHGPVTWTCPVP